ncbi:GNAT family N-acetyltransferase [Paenibacillus flagellatus]|uniref:GNAT family N-acetyltransferase n=1 Tax=Paenibacillus flagellatus TaxID=2211139 RepID=A0A2V5K9N1_9BACL|nr:N-acetyltransferase [Paenibacillus flagellatus]PYI54633.1 GNAT family N-acetyltransferase [Paenibacillus flagellatus]
MLIRTETANDHDAVFRLNREAFGGRETESRLVERIRGSAGFIPELSLVAVRNGRVVGHLLLSKAEIVDGERRHEAVVLAPIAVLPEEQRKGIGRALIGEGFERCVRLGFEVVCLIGHPDYYPRFGFRPAKEAGLELKQFRVPDDVFMVRELREGALQEIGGELRYPESFWTLSDKEETE